MKVRIAIVVELDPAVLDETERRLLDAAPERDGIIDLTAWTDRWEGADAPPRLAHILAPEEAVRIFLEWRGRMAARALDR